jgi:hypothetical protein
LPANVAMSSFLFMLCPFVMPLCSVKYPVKS